MNEYKIIKTNVEGYDRLVLCLTFESLLTYIKKLNVLYLEPKQMKQYLLITGDGANRFMSCLFKNGKLYFKH